MKNMLCRFRHVAAGISLVISLLLTGCGGGGSAAPSNSNSSDNCNGGDTYTAISSPVTTIAAAARVSFVITDDGSLWSFGNSTKGQLGVGTTTNSINPLRIGKIGDVFTAVSAGFGYTLALKDDGTLWAWGKNSFGQLGNDSTTDSNVPVQVGSDTNYTEIAAGFNFSLALKSDGTLWAWGDNQFGELGIGDDNVKISKVPVQVGSDTTYTAISAGTAHALALKSDGSLWAWGDNSYGELGDGCYVDATTKNHVCTIRSDATKSNVPEPIDSGSSYAAISAGYLYSLAIRDDGTLMAWGSNANGNLGTGDTIHSGTSQQIYLTPTKIGDGFKPDPNALSASKFSVLGNTTVYFHSLALKTDGSIWAWGDNLFGQVGDGTRETIYAPEQILSGSGYIFTAVSAGEDDHSLAIKSDGSLWAWGFNSCGALGNGNTQMQFSPIQVSK